MKACILRKQVLRRESVKEQVMKEEVQFHYTQRDGHSVRKNSPINVGFGVHLETKARTKVEKMKRLL